ncbi:hypothetical protein, partial [Nevskia sp.]|uniref:hypothetical protein n=1 Tax=Nevskia sp. TaxID=1929292 RepID=UPI0025EAEC4C
RQGGGPTPAQRAAAARPHQALLPTRAGSVCRLSSTFECRLNNDAFLSGPDRNGTDLKQVCSHPDGRIPACPDDGNPIPAIEAVYTRGFEAIKVRLIIVKQLSSGLSSSRYSCVPRTISLFMSAFLHRRSAHRNASILKPLISGTFDRFVHPNVALQFNYDAVRVFKHETC